MILTLSTLTAAGAVSQAAEQAGAVNWPEIYSWGIFALSWVLVVSGSFFVLVGSIGLIRMPDLFTRMHAVSVVDTIGAGLLIGGMMLQAGASIVTLKLLFIFLLLVLSSPVATHALAQAALHAGERPELKEDRTAGASSTLSQVDAEKDR